MYYNNDFYIEYTKDYNSLTTKKRHITSKTLKNVLYFDIGHWDYTYFKQKEENSYKNLPSAYFKTLQMSFETQKAGEDFFRAEI